jgi:hypothetical protein
MPKPSKKGEARLVKKPEPSPPSNVVKIPNYATRKRQAEAAATQANAQIAKYQNPNVSTSCVYNKGFTGLKVGG